MTTIIRNTQNPGCGERYNEKAHPGSDEHGVGEDNALDHRTAKDHGAHDVRRHSLGRTRAAVLLAKASSRSRAAGWVLTRPPTTASA